MKKLHILLLSSVLFSTLMAPSLSAHPVWIQAHIGPETLWLEVAASPKAQQQGLMWRFVLSNQQGMLFISDKDTRKCMWMKNTPTPLDVAFINKHWEIINTHTMPPYTKNYFCSDQPARYAIEVNAGWFQFWRQRGLTTIELKKCLSMQLLQIRGLPTMPQ